jgi:hypothetical protein
MAEGRQESFFKDRNSSAHGGALSAGLPQPPLRKIVIVAVKVGGLLARIV